MGLPLSNFEASQVPHYAPGQEFKPNHDYFGPASHGFQDEIALSGQRVATFLMFLNDEFTGGDKMDLLAMGK
jgi:prolyl 4-hydroxylase